MRVVGWDARKFDQEFADATEDRLVKAAEVIAEAARNECPVGTVSRPMYKHGPYANKPWTARDAGQLKRSIRVVQLREKYGAELWKNRNVRVYAGHYLAYYASIVEKTNTPFMRRAWWKSMGRIKSILGAV